MGFAVLAIDVSVARLLPLIQGGPSEELAAKRLLTNKACLFTPTPRLRSHVEDWQVNSSLEVKFRSFREAG